VVPLQEALSALAVAVQVLQVVMQLYQTEGMAEMGDLFPLQELLYIMQVAVEVEMSTQVQQELVAVEGVALEERTLLFQLLERQTPVVVVAEVLTVVV
jgi:hypothetical protein